MTFDPFRDFDSRGYLRNLLGSKNPIEVKALEYASFQGNLDRAVNALANIELIEYKHVLAIHETLFSDVYPWAGQDRLTTAPTISVSKGGYEGMFAIPTSIRLATDYALQQSRDKSFMRDRPGVVMGSLAHAHPFLDGNGRTIMTIHTELAYRAGIEIDWLKTEKSAYLEALTNELYQPERGHLDRYLQPFIRPATERIRSFATLKTLKGLGNTIEPPNPQPEYLARLKEEFAPTRPEPVEDDPQEPLTELDIRLRKLNDSERLTNQIPNDVSPKPLSELDIELKQLNDLERNRTINDDDDDELSNGDDLAL